MKRNRRIKTSRLQTIFIKARSVTKDSEGVPEETFGEAVEKKAEIWPATARRQVEQYGDRITGISNARVQGRFDIDVQSHGIIFEDGTILAPAMGYA